MSIPNELSAEIAVALILATGGSLKPADAKELITKIRQTLQRLDEESKKKSSFKFQNTLVKDKSTHELI